MHQVLNTNAAIQTKPRKRKCNSGFFQMLSVLLYSNSCIRRVLNVSLKVSFTDTNTIFDFNLKKLTSNKIYLGMISTTITKLVFVYYHYTQKFFIYNCNLRISVYYLTTTNDVMLCCVLIIMKNGLRLHNYFWFDLDFELQDVFKYC